ncbi:MAG: DUF2085 domain-containing protein, partial [Candidatus Promineifilaceae bacterium]
QQPPPLTGRQRSFVIGVDRAVYWFSRHWLAVFNVLVMIYVGLPILAPVLMNAGVEGPARVIYTVYKPMCHQMTQRSFFLFGEQYAYPRAVAGTDLQPIEAYVSGIDDFKNIPLDDWPAFFAAARSFVGNEQLGYKIALCERDVGIYGFILIAGLLFGLLRNRIKIRPLPLILFIIIGLGPIALDGFSQLFSYWALPTDGSAPAGLMATIANLLPLRESTPLLRTITGGLFGFMLVWLAYPQVEQGMAGTREDLRARLSRIEEDEAAADTS